MLTSQPENLKRLKNVLPTPDKQRSRHMDSTESTNDKIQPKPSHRRLTTYLALLIMVLQVLISLVTYPFLPAMVPSHWNAAGQIDAYMPKLFNAILFPLMSIGIYFLIRGLYAISPRLGNQPKNANLEVINIILVGVLLLMLVVQLTTTAAALGVPIDITLVMGISMSLLFIFIGNYMVKLRRNFWGGIRTPWTLASDTVWERTHRFGGWLFVMGGLLMLVLSFIPALRIGAIIIIPLTVALVPVVYSYFAYQRYVVQGEEPLSPPFDTGSEV
jgi:uncharacterized membrane protein